MIDVNDIKKVQVIATRQIQQQPTKNDLLSSSIPMAMASSSTAAAITEAAAMAAKKATGSGGSPALTFNILAECGTTKARTSIMKLPHYTVELPMFMPVGTQGTMKGLLPKQVKDAGAQIILGNTYHLGMRPGTELLDQFSGLHNFMQWDRALLTDSGGFQMVSLLELAQITEEGVKFKSPYDGAEIMLTPEKSMEIQNSIGADIMMQLDDVVNVTETEYERFKTATYRTTRWLDRCLAANKNTNTQNLFPIIQGGLFPDLRKISLEQLIARDAPGYAIGGLSGGEDKDKFWPTVHLCTDHLPRNKPRYCMGVGYAVDLVVCVALGVDMFDCVFPTRTARFGCALVDNGQLNLKQKEFKEDFNPIDENCSCSTCANYTRAYLHTIVTKETVSCNLLSIHNITYLMKLMSSIRESIKKGEFVDFVHNFMANYYEGKKYPQWIIDSLAAVKINLKNPENSVEMKESSSDADIWDEEGKNPVEMKESSSNTDIWDEEDDDIRSGFGRTSHSLGYMNGVLEDYDQDEEKGRIKGYHAGYVSEVTQNPTLKLARLDGVLKGCLIKCGQNMNEKQHHEAEWIKKEINNLIKLIVEPPKSKFEQDYECVLDQYTSESDKPSESCCKDETGACSSDNSCSKKPSSSVQDRTAEVSRRMEVFCQLAGWCIPTFND